MNWKTIFKRKKKQDYQLHKVGPNSLAIIDSSGKYPESYAILNTFDEEDVDNLIKPKISTEEDRERKLAKLLDK